MDIPIVDDAVLENYELFNVSLERNELDSRIILDPVDGLVEITDNESMGTNRSPVAVVGLEETFYTTSEGEGAVLVCAIVYMPDNTLSCPIAFEFTVYLSNAEFTAGTSGPLYSMYSIL